MRIVMITLGMFLGLMLVMGFALADLTQMSRKKDPGPKERETSRSKLVSAVPADRGTQVRAIRFFLRKFPGTAAERIKAFPDEAVVQAVVQVLQTEKDAGRRKIYLEILAERRKSIAARKPPAKK